MFPSISDIIKTCLEDLRKRKHEIHGNETHIKAALEWLCLAQDRTGDGGVAAWYSPLIGWGSSYIETTGYIIDTFLSCAEFFKDKSLAGRAMNMADFIINNQHESGGYRTHTRKHKEISPPTIFDTGQDLLGLTNIYKLTAGKKYLESFIRAANFLCNIQEKDGSWIKFQYGHTSHNYDTRVAWSLIKVWEITKDSKYKKAALRNLAWAARSQQINGWFRKAELPPPNPRVPFTHTIAYTIEGFLFSGILLKDDRWIRIAQKCADRILEYFERENFIPGTFDENWQSNDKYSCLTGDAQISVVWLNLFKLTRDGRYLESARKINAFLKGTQDIKTSNKNIKGAIKGSFPLYGDLWQGRGYCRMTYLNWATKFFIDALLLEQELSK